MRNYNTKTQKHKETQTYKNRDSKQEQTLINGKTTTKRCTTVTKRAKAMTHTKYLQRRKANKKKKKNDILN